MLALGLIDLITVAITAVVGASILSIMLFRLTPARPNQPMISQVETHGPVFLIEDERIVDATPEAVQMIAQYARQMDEYEAILHVLSPHFPNLREGIEELGDEKIQIEGTTSDGLFVELDRRGNRLRLSVRGRHTSTSTNDVLNRDVRLSELAMLRDLTKHSPQLIWQEDFTGKLLWANHAYLSFHDRLKSDVPGSTSTWPSAPIFPELQNAPPMKARSVRRVSVPLADQRAEHWFDVTSVKRDDGFLHFAADANAIVRADQDRRHFVQTLSKTFAQLAIGLAIFDKRRQLATFNPALMDLTRLPIDFLSSRPTIDAFLDRLREARMLPEPPNYASWREQFTAVESAVRDGSYCQNWNLVDGQTYRVTGNPHPDGAFALMMEDISASISMTQRFRTDIETSQAVLDTLDDAIAVFSSAGTLVMSNKAYANLWGDTVSYDLQQVELQTAMKSWQSRCTPTPMWSELRKFISMVGTRSPWSDDAILDDGRHIRCNANAITGGMTMVKFSFAPPATPVIRKLMVPDTALLAAKR